MIVSLKDGAKLVGVTVVCFCATFVCTFFINYYIDATAIGGSIPSELSEIYDAQILTAKLVCIITGGILCLIAAVMVMFYIKLYIDGNTQKFGVLKALGYSERRLAAGFWVFGLSVFIGALIGYGAGHAAMPFIYGELTVNGLPKISVSFHAELFLYIVIAPSVAYCALSCGYAVVPLRKSAAELMRSDGSATRRKKADSTRTQKRRHAFFTDMCISVLSSKKSVVFFAAFSCFCFSAMIQMGLSMDELSSVTMGMMILLIGVVLGVMALFMAAASVINANKRNIAVMKAFGYSQSKRLTAVLIGYLPFAFVGFGLGTAYQYGLLRLMVDIVFAGVDGMPDYSFDVEAFFIAFAAFIAVLACATAYLAIKLNKISVKHIMEE